jgi:hypothetical protein
MILIFSKNFLNLKSFTICQLILKKNIKFKVR